LIPGMRGFRRETGKAVACEMVREDRFDTGT